MNYNIIVSPVASKNLEVAIVYYIEKATKKVALNFLKDYRKTYKALQTLFINFKTIITGFYLLKNSLTLLFLLWMSKVKLFS
jgi:hypothetical protein